MIGCKNVTGSETTKGDAAASGTAALPPFPPINDTPVAFASDYTGSCNPALNQVPNDGAAPPPSSSEDVNASLSGQILAGSDYLSSESNRVQGVVAAKAAPAPSSLDALALACAAQDMRTKGSLSPRVDMSASSTPIVSNKSHQGAADSLSRESDDGLGSPSFQLTNNDVLCGRGGLTNHHPGNVFFRRMVRMRQEDYLRASKRDKAGVARDIVDTIRKLDPPGRFLKKDSTNPGMWVEIGNRKAREKTSQALREGAPEKREELSNHATVPTTTAKESEPIQLFTKTSITASEIDLAACASVGCVQRARIVSSDSDGGNSSFTPFQEAHYIQGLTTSSYQVSNKPFCGSPTMVTPTLTPSSTCLEPMDTSVGQGGELPVPPLFCGMKRKMEHSTCSVQDEQMQEADAQRDAHQRSPGGMKRGPRLRIFKERMMEPCH